MTVGQLIEELRALDVDPDTPVILQKDPEGNGYSPCVGAAAAFYEPESHCRGEVLDDDQGGAIPCVVLWLNG